MYKSVAEINAMIGELKDRKYMTVSDKMIDAYGDEERNKKTAVSNRLLWRNNAQKREVGKQQLTEERRKAMNKGLAKVWKDNKKTGELSKKLSKIFRNCAKSRKIVTPYGEFSCVADFGDLKVGTFNNLNNKIPHLYYYAEEGPGEVLYEKVWYSPSGVKNSLKEIYEFENDSTDKCRYARSVWWGMMVKNYPNEYYTKIEEKREWRNIK